MAFFCVLGRKRAPGEQTPLSARNLRGAQDTHDGALRTEFAAQCCMNSKVARRLQMTPLTPKQQSRMLRCSRQTGIVVLELRYGDYHRDTARQTSASTHAWRNKVCCSSRSRSFCFGLRSGVFQWRCDLRRKQRRQSEKLSWPKVSRTLHIVRVET